MLYVRGDIMKNCNAAMPSYTYAVKAQKLLKTRGYNCTIKRTEPLSDEGCGYSLVIEGNCDEIQSILDSYSIPFNNLRNEVN